MSAADLANDQDRELTVVTAERDDLKLRLDEAEAVIDAVRKVRDTLSRRSTATRTVVAHYEGGEHGRGRADAFDEAVGQLDGVDGL